ncbi:MAG: HAMP domain-containing histidine kinase [Clostridiales bacterium]|nr:HAMP domain-containing histidine kinase [Clostridiales bacterium]
MSVRLRIITHSLVAILVLNTIGVAVGFLLFYLVGNPYLGERLNDNLGIISTRYFLLGAIVVLALTGIGALWLISVTVRHVTGPLQRLNRAASEIRDGNLGYELVVSGQDEFAELGAGFEQMRIRLKDSMWLQEKAEAERRTMMASVTHDLKTPITSIIGYAEGILDGVADTPEKTLEYAAVICKKARSLQALSEDLSLLSRLENAQLPLYKQEEDLGAIVYELANEFSHNEPNLKLTMELAPGIMVSIDKEKISRVLINLFQNSVKYKKPDQVSAEVSLTLIRQENAALLTVSDKGMGVTPGDLPHLFEQFYRADSSRGRQSGSGLGLTIARQLVHLHNGKIWIISDPDGGLSVNIALSRLGG